MGNVFEACLDRRRKHSVGVVIVAKGQTDLFEIVRTLRSIVRRTRGCVFIVLRDHPVDQIDIQSWILARLQSFKVGPDHLEPLLVHFVRGLFFGCLTRWHWATWPSDVACAGTSLSVDRAGMASPQPSKLTATAARRPLIQFSTRLAILPCRHGRRQTFHT